MKYITFRYILYSISLLLLVPKICFCFDDNITHPELTNKAANLSKTDSYLKDVLGFSDGLDTIIDSNSTESRTILKKLRKGSTDEDHPPCRASSHFHNPLLPWGQSYNTDAPEYISFWCHDVPPAWPLFSNVTWATGLTQTSQTTPISRDRQDMGWDNARTYFYQALTSNDKTDRENNFIKTFGAVGQVMHLLQDMAVPAHVRNDFQSPVMALFTNPAFSMQLNIDKGVLS